MNNNEQNNVNARIRAEGQKLGKKAILGYGFASLVGGIACAITAVLLFTCVPLSGTAKVIYYVVFTILFWISYSTWYVPYTAFGAEIAIDYDSRTKLRVPAIISPALCSSRKQYSRRLLSYHRCCHNGIFPSDQEKT